MVITDDVRVLRIEPLTTEHLEALAQVLRHPLVYRHIEGGVPPVDAFRIDLERALAGPPPDLADERWLHFLVRNAQGAMLGRLEATLHHGIAEVGFLLGPAHWRQGHGGRALDWLHQHLSTQFGIRDFWATTTPANRRSQALLLRSGYRLASEPKPLLYSLSEGDQVFRRCVSD